MSGSKSCCRGHRRIGVIFCSVVLLRASTGRTRRRCWRSGAGPGQAQRRTRPDPRVHCYPGGNGGYRNCRVEMSVSFVRSHHGPVSTVALNSYGQIYKYVIDIYCISVCFQRLLLFFDLYRRMFFTNRVFFFD